jgi:hypothetical protein
MDDVATAIRAGEVAKPPESAFMRVHRQREERRARVVAAALVEVATHAERQGRTAFAEALREAARVGETRDLALLGRYLRWG